MILFTHWLHVLMSWTILQDRTGFISNWLYTKYNFPNFITTPQLHYVLLVVVISVRLILVQILYNQNINICADISQPLCEIFNLCVFIIGGIGNDKFMLHVPIYQLFHIDDIFIGVSKFIFDVVGTIKTTLFLLSSEKLITLNCAVVKWVLNLDILLSIWKFSIHLSHYLWMVTVL